MGKLTFAKVNKKGGIEGFFVRKTGITQKVLHVNIFRNLIYGFAVIKVAHVFYDK